ncbi:MAG: hypothetical protein ACTSU4_00400 [Promethearchaeota archaeon]
MTRVNEKYWMGSFLGSAMCLLSFLFPAAWSVRYFPNGDIYYKFIWMIGLVEDYLVSAFPTLYFHDYPLIILSSIACSFCIIAFNIFLLRQSYLVKKGKLEMEDVENNWIFYSFFSFLFSLAWMLLIHVAFIIFYGRTVSFWRYFYMGPGLYLIFAGSFISIIGILIKKRRYENLL